MRRPLLAVSLAVVAATGLLSGAPSRALADDGTGVTQTAATVVRLDAAKGRLQVAITIKVANHTPDGVEQYGCTKYTGGFWPIPYPATCERAVRYYVEQTTVDVDAAAVNVRAASGKRALEVVDGTGRGPDRRLAARHRSRSRGCSSAAAGRSSSATPSGAASHAPSRRPAPCAPSPGSAWSRTGPPSGSVTVRVPKRFAMTTSGAKLKASVSGTDRVFASGPIAATADWQACFTGTNAGAYRTERLAGPGGATIRLRSWPEDNAWADGVRDDVAAGVPLLERLTGVAPATTGPIDIRETGSGGRHSGTFDGTTNTITLGEDFGEPALVQHELAHAWFNLSVFDEPWLAEGYAEWAGRAVAGAEPCGEPDDSAGPIDLASWGQVSASSTDAERAAAVTQYLAACHVVTAVAAAAGEERMTTATIALLSRRDPYAIDGGGSGTRAAKVAGWREWLDAIDELALDPAGAPDGFAAGLLDPVRDRHRRGAAPGAGRRAARLPDPGGVRRVGGARGGEGAPRRLEVRRGLAGDRRGLGRVGRDRRDGRPAAGRRCAGRRRRGRLAGRAEPRGPACGGRPRGPPARGGARRRRGTRGAGPAAGPHAEGRHVRDRRAAGLDDAILAVRAGDVDAAAQAAARIRESVAGLRAAGEQRIALGTVLAIVLLACLAFAYTRHAVAARARRAEARASASVVAVGTAQSWRPAPAGESFDTNPLDESPTQAWVPPPILVTPNMEGDPDLIAVAKLVKRRPPED